MFYELTPDGAKMLGLDGDAGGVLSWEQLAARGSDRGLLLKRHGDAVSCRGVTVAKAAAVMTVSEAMQVLGVSRITLYHWLRAGKLKGRRVRNLWMIPSREVKQLLRTREGA